MAAFKKATLRGLVLLLLVSACGNEPPPRARQLLSGDAKPADDDGDSDDASDDVDGDDATDGSDQGDVDGDDGATGDDGASLDELFRSCRIDPEHPDKELVNLDYAGLPVVKHGTVTVIILPIPYTATIMPKLNITGSMKRSVSTTAVTVAMDPSAAQAKGDEEAKKASATVTTDLMPLDARTNLSDTAPQWDGVACTVPAATKITTVSGVGTTVTTFAPALPSSISPIPEVARFEAELSSPKTFTGIVATVMQSADPSIPVGSKHSGVVTVRPIDPTYQVTQDDGSTVTVGGDLAYAVEASFGTPAVTAALGVRPVTRYFIDTAAQNFKAIVVDSGTPGLAPMVFIRK